MGNIFLLMIDFHAYGTFPWVFPRTSFHSCHRLLTLCASVCNGWQEPCHPSSAPSTVSRPDFSSLVLVIVSS